MYKVVLAGFILDLIVGDPMWIPHPVCFIGNMISKGEKIIRKIFPKTERGEFAGGGVLVFIVLMICFFLPWSILYLISGWNKEIGFILESFFCYQIFATKSLKTESMKVFYGLKEQGVSGGRSAVSMIVGRDTQELSEEGVIKACVETIAENTTDGVIAPMIFMLIGGAPLGFLYKAINTLDSMIGYKNEKYLYFGKIGAKLDDFANFIPARMAAVCMMAASIFTRNNTKGSVKIFWRDRKNHKSPNSAQTESVMAGALNIQLAGDAFYFGKKYEKPTIGNFIRQVEKEDIIRANRILYVTAVLAMFLCGILRYICYSV